MKKKSRIFSIIKKILLLLYPKTEIIGKELRKDPCIYVGNHAQIHGPLIGELHYPDSVYLWCAGEMMNRKEVPRYAFLDFWSQKPKWTHPFYKVVSHLIAPLAQFIFQNARTIPVYRDKRIVKTFKDSLFHLTEGRSIMIFPEKDEKRNRIIYEFQAKFIDLARMYHKKTGKEIAFVPVYHAPKLKKSVIGEPIFYNSQGEKEEERERIRHYLMEEITKMGEQLPLHTVIPYRNIPKKYYPKNQEEK